VYGADGYNVINDTVSYPAYATVTPSGQAAWTWASSTSDGRALQKAAGTDRIAATWYGGVFSIDVNVTDGGTHQVAVYAVDWDGGGRSETIEMRDAATNGVLDTRTLSGFGGGRYLLWTVSGHVVIRVTNLTGPNAVVAGLFFGGGGSTGGGSSAAFIGTDTTTQGSWRGVYGADGYHVINDTVSYPAYATVTPSGQAAWTWASSTSDGRALQKAAGTDRIAATWYGGTFSLDVNLVDGAAHELGLYVVDWDGGGRIERLEIRDAVSNALLDSRTVAGFQGGQYWRWNVSGHVKVQVVSVAGVNAVVNGIYFR
jgi:hypothetical protein